ncbi:MAG: NADH-quinone oxidoreductase subunit E, partial [Acetobacteraceae bacterium]|nr:NADH-quinone oxidoreductase subunit E [Acetobacteraceae bacterium]
LPVAGPLAVAALLLTLSKLLPRPVPDVVAMLTAIAAALACGVMAANTTTRPLVYWFGNWVPSPDGPVLGISFLVDGASAAFAAFVASLFAAAFVFAWGYYDEVHAHFHVLMLLFMAAMIGFCLTHDLFNLFVWFELMSIAAFAVTGFALRVSALDAALNFTVVNTIGSYLILGGIGLIYAQAGALEFAALGKAVAAAPSDPVITASFALIGTGLLIKAAQVPFQFWLADAHSVAPSPVSVIFSGAMVGIGAFGLAKITWQIYGGSPVVTAVVHTLLMAMAVASVVVGGVMALVQRHIKRLLAFSTISHVGIMLCGLALLRQDALGGMLAYLVAHGLVKGALFMIAGILLASCGGIDEIGLIGMGRQIWPAGIAMAVGGLLLAGMPVGVMHAGTDLIETGGDAAGLAWLRWPLEFGAACTGAAVLRVTGRVFAGLGHTPGEEERAPTDEEREKADRPLWLMLAPAAVMLALALIGPGFERSIAVHAAGLLMHAGTSDAAEAVAGGQSSLLPWIFVAFAVAVAAWELGRGHLPRLLVRGTDAVLNPALAALQALHSGLVSDYVTWIVVGLAGFAVAFALV